MRALTWRRLLGASLAAAPLATLVAWLAFDDPWWTPDQQAARLYRGGAFAEAAGRFSDPAWRAAALYRDHRFRDAAAIWSGVPGAEAAYDRGNALVFLGQYDEAVASYERALELRPDWTAARVNRDIAASRIRADTALGEASAIGADDVVFDSNMNDDEAAAEPVEVTGGEALGDAELRARWLRNLRSDPADFLRLKFSYQFAARAAQDAPQ